MACGGNCGRPCCQGLGADYAGAATSFVSSSPELSALSFPLFGTVGVAVPVIGTALAVALWGFSKIGAGRTEADIITTDPGPQPLVDRFAADAAASLGVSVYGCGNISASVPTESLHSLRNDLWKVGQGFLDFLRDRQIFTDGRASMQAANDEMPKFDGTSNYGLFASGGYPVDAVPGQKVHVCGGLVGAIDRELRNRSLYPSIAQTALQPGRTPSVITEAVESIMSPVPDLGTVALVALAGLFILGRR